MTLFYTYNQNNQFYAVKMHKMKTNEGMPCYYDLRIGIVMQLSYYVFVIFTATTVTFEVKYLIFIWLSGGSRGGSRVAVVAVKAFI